MRRWGRREGVVEGWGVGGGKGCEEVGESEEGRGVRRCG